MFEWSNLLQQWNHHFAHGKVWKRQNPTRRSHLNAASSDWDYRLIKMSKIHSRKLNVRCEVFIKTWPRELEENTTFISIFELYEFEIYEVIFISAYFSKSNLSNCMIYIQLTLVLVAIFKPWGVKTNFKRRGPSKI